MKFANLYVAIAFLAMTSLLAACDKENPTLFDDAGNGVYFDYDSKDDMMTDCNFGDYYLENPMELSFTVKIRLLGYLGDHARAITLKAKPVEGYPEVEFVSLPEITFEAGEYEKEVVLTVARPAEEGVQHASCLYIDSSIGTGLEGFEEFIVYSGIIYKEPENWANVKKYFGEWSKDKHFYLIEHYGANDYVKLGSAVLESGYIDLYKKLLAMGDKTELEIPVCYLRDYVYPKPAYWGELQEKYICLWDDAYGGLQYKTRPYARIASELGLTTKTVEAFFNRSDEAGMKVVNKVAVEIMQEVYNTLYLNADPMYTEMNNFVSDYYVELSPDVEYDVIQPACWTADLEPQANEMLSKYYGEYNPDKLKFMMKTLAENGRTYLGLFPLYKQWDSKTQSYEIKWFGTIYSSCYFAWGMINWDYYVDGGESYVATLNQLFRNADADNRYNFPVVESAGEGSGKDDGKK